MATGSNIQQRLQAKVKQIERETQQIANQTVWQTLQEILPQAQEKLREIIIERFYNMRPKSEFYDRTYQFANCGLLKPTQGGGRYVMQVWLNTLNLEAQPPQNSDSSEKHMLWSYAYSYGKSLVGTPLDLGERQQLVDEWDETYGITEAFQEWFTDEFPELFEKNFHIRMRKVFNYGGF